MNEVIRGVCAVVGSGLVWWWVRELCQATCFQCVWCERTFGFNGQVVGEDDPMVARPGMCPACRELAQHDFPRQ